jgi:hypothetical protein
MKTEIGFGQRMGLRVLACLVAAGAALPVGTAQAATASKDVALGPTAATNGGPRRSHWRTFYVPAGVTMTTSFRLSTTQSQSVKVRVDLFEPGEDSTTFEGPFGPLKATKEVLVTQSGTSGSFPTFTSPEGCPNTWRVRVTIADNEPQNVDVKGTVTVVSGTAASIAHETSRFTVVQGVTEQKNIHDPETAGDLVITGTWDSPVFNAGGLDVRGLPLTVKLYRGGELMATEKGYPQNANFVDDSDRLVLKYKVTREELEEGGNWTVKVVGSSLGTCENIVIKTRLTPRCY